MLLKRWLAASCAATLVVCACAGPARSGPPSGTPCGRCLHGASAESDTASRRPLGSPGSWGSAPLVDRPRDRRTARHVRVRVHGCRREGCRQDRRPRDVDAIRRERTARVVGRWRSRDGGGRVLPIRDADRSRWRALSRRPRQQSDPSDRRGRDHHHDRRVRRVRRRPGVLLGRRRSGDIGHPSGAVRDRVRCRREPVHRRPRQRPDPKDRPARGHHDDRRGRQDRGPRRRWSGGLRAPCQAPRADRGRRGEHPLRRVVEPPDPEDRRRRDHLDDRRHRTQRILGRWRPSHVGDDHEPDVDRHRPRRQRCLR